MGGQGAVRKGPEDARPRARPSRAARPGLSDDEHGSVGFCGTRRAERTAEGSAAHPAADGVRRRRQHAFLRQRSGEPIQGDPALRLDSRVSGRWSLAHLGAAVLSLERPRLRGERQRRCRDRLARSLPRHRAVVRLRRAVRRRQRREARTAASARRAIPEADAVELPGEARQGADREDVPGPPPDDRPRCASDGTVERPRRVPVPQPLLEGLPVRCLLQQRGRHASRGRADRQSDHPSVLDRPLHCV